MKKMLLMLVLSALLLISAFAAENTVYVNDGGTGDGSSAETPLGSLADAYAALGTNGGTIVVTDKLTLTETFTEPSHSGEIIITGGTVSVENMRFVLNGATTFENVTLHGNGAYLLVVAQFNPIVLGENVTVSGFGNFSTVAKSLTILGGVQSGSDKYKDASLLTKDTSITVKSGKALIVGFSRDVNATFTGTANISIEGGTIYNVYMGCIGSGSGGSVNMSISGGTFVSNAYSNAKSSKLAGNINLTITGGDFSASTLETIDVSVDSGATSVVDVSALENYITVVGKLSGYTTLITKEGGETPVERTEVYINDGGTGDGSSAETPLGSLAMAYTALGSKGGKIIITDTLTLPSKFTEPAHEGIITITGGTLAVDNGKFYMNGATTFENLTINGVGAYLHVVAQFNPIVFGENVTVNGFGDFTSTTTGLIIIGGVQSGEGNYNDASYVDKDTYITVKSGRVTVTGFSRRYDKAFTGTANINIEGGTIYNLYMGSITNGTGGNANINISGGTFIFDIYSNAKSSKLTGNIDLRITGGDFSASTLETFDGSVADASTSVADVRGLNNYSTVVEKMSGFKKIITDEGEIIPDEKTDIQAAFLYGSFTASDGTVMPYRYYLPEGYETSGKDYPVFIYMHGNGSRGTNNTSQLASYSVNHAIYNSDYECIMIAPQCPTAPYEWSVYGSLDKKACYYPGGEAYADFLEGGEPYPSKYFVAAAELLNMFLTDYRVDTSKVYAGGGSNGAGAVWNFMTLYPEVFAAAIPVSGSHAVDDFVHAVAHRMTDIPIWAFQGDADKTILPEETRTMVNAIKELGGNITYTEVAGATHGTIWKIAADTPGVVDWLFAQTNDSFENTISKEKGPALEAPKNLKWDATVATWDAVENAGAYRVTFYVDGVMAKSVFTYNNYYTPDFSSFASGECTFTVTAHPKKNAYSISDESAASVAYSAEIDIDKVADIDGDGSITVKDVLLLIRVIVNKQNVTLGDVSGDGKVTLLDAIRIMKHILSK